MASQSTAPTFDLSDIPDAAPVKPVVAAPVKPAVTAPAAAGVTPAPAAPTTAAPAKFDLSDIPDAAKTPPPADDTSFIGESIKNIGRFARAAVRGAVTTVHGVTAPIRAVTGMAPLVPPPEETTTAGKMGRAVEQVAEYLPLASLATKGVKALSIASTVAKGAAKAGAGPLAAKIAASIPEGIAQGAAAFGLSKAHGDTTGSASTTGAISAASPAAGAALDHFGPAILTNARAAMAKVLAAGLAPAEQTARIAKVTAQGALDALDLPLQRTWLQFKTTTAAGRKAAGQTLEQGLKSPAGAARVPIQPITDALNDLINTGARHTVTSTSPVTTFNGKALQPPYSYAQTIKKVTYNPPLLKAVNELKTTLSQYGLDASAAELHDIKEVWQAAVFPKQALKNPVTSTVELLTTAQKQARMKGAVAIADALETHAPSISQLDQATSHAINLDNMVRRLALSAGKDSGSSAKYAIRYTARAAGAAGGSMVGIGTVGRVVGSLVGLTGVSLFQRAFESPIWKTAAPIIKDRLAKSIISGDVERVRKILVPIIAGIKPEKPESVSPPGGQ